MLACAFVVGPNQGRIKASAGPVAVPNAGTLQTYNQVTTLTNCGPLKLRARVLQRLAPPPHLIYAALDPTDIVGRHCWPSITTFNTVQHVDPTDAATYRKQSHFTDLWSLQIWFNMAEKQ